MAQLMRTALKHIAFISCLLFSSHHTAYPVEIREYFNELRVAEMQLSAVTTDMYLYLGWMFEEKAALRKAVQKAHADLEELKVRLVETNPPADQAQLKDVFLEMVDQLERIYQGIETKHLDAIKNEFAPFNDLYGKYAKLLKAAGNEPEVNGEIDQDGASLEEELRWLERPEDQDTYRSAVSLMEERKMAKAYEILNGFEHAFGDLPAAHLIQLRISDSLCMMDAERATEIGFTGEVDANEHALALLSEIVESDRYSPVLYEAFYKWRTTTQAAYHGMSNWSEIPNKEYNEKRWHVLQAIKKYLVENPGDVWARTQLALLWDLPNIQRGGPFGNDNLVHWGILYRVLDGEDQSGK